MLLPQVEETILKHGLLRTNDRVVVAVSGGPDSIALLHILRSLQKRRKLYLHVAHFNHSLRALDAEKDSVFVKATAETLGLSCTIETKKVGDFARDNKLCIEEAARNLRMDFLLRVCRGHCATKLALGHTRDDQAETVLMRFLRGSGLAGLRAIPITRKIEDCWIIRPLLEIWRAQIIEYLKAKKLSFRIDRSNLENIYLRNKIRNSLIPFLEKDFNPNIKEVLANFADNIGDDIDFLDKTSEKKYKAACERADGTKVILRSKKFFALDNALQKMVARAAIKALKGDTRSIDYRHWKEIEDLGLNRPKNSIVDLPGGISIMKSEKLLTVYKRQEK